MYNQAYITMYLCEDCIEITKHEVTPVWVGAEMYKDYQCLKCGKKS